jgi:hypothetical protein
MTTRIRKAAALTAAVLLGAYAQAGVAQPAGTYPRFIGTSQDGEIDYGPGPHGNVVGGGNVRAIGGGENLQLVHEGPAQTQEPIYAHAVGGGENLIIVYSPIADRTAALAAAGVLGGGATPARPGSPVPPARTDLARYGTGD